MNRRQLLQRLCAAPAAAQRALRSATRTTDMNVADPWIFACTERKRYYLYQTASGPDGRGVIYLYQSRDLEVWDGPKPVFTAPDTLWANPQHGLSAPEVHEYRGAYYLLATLFNRDVLISHPPDSWRRLSRQATHIFVSDSPEGPFTPRADAPPTPPDAVTRDATLCFQADIPFLIYSHDWQQIINGAIAAVRMKTDLTAPAGEPFFLFRGSDAPWLSDQFRASKAPRYYPASGPQCYRTRSGDLLLLWSSTREGLGAIAVARSLSGKIRGPWIQEPPLLSDDCGQSCLFRSFDGRTLMAVQSPLASPLSKLRILELREEGNSLRLQRG